MSESGYILNHWITVVWLFAAALYLYGAVIADVVASVRAGKDRARDESRD